MAGFKIAQLKRGEDDALGVKVECIYTINDPTYAIYRSACRVMVQFADTQLLADHQRTMLTPLASLRGQISGLIDGWHDGSSGRAKDKARCFDHRVAAALDTALQGELARAGSLLEEVRDAIVVDRRSWARFQYLLVASASAAAGLAVVALIVLLLGFTGSHEAVPRILSGLIGGTFGAFFSIATGLQKRTILTDLQKRDNICDAILRVVIGLMAAGVLVCFMESRFIQGITLGGETAAATGPAWLKFLVAGFIAGFSERLVPDLLAKAAVVGTPNAETGGKDAAAQAATVPSESALAAAAAVASAGAVQTATPADPIFADEGDDHCPCDAPPVLGEEVTSDEDLPVTIGGVSASVTAPAPNVAQPGGGPNDETGQEQAAE